MVLNGIVHPAVRERMNEKKVAAIERGEYLVVMDIPLLFESELTDLVEKIILVYVDEEIQLERLMREIIIPKQRRMLGLSRKCH